RLAAGPADRRPAAGAGRGPACDRARASDRAAPPRRAGGRRPEGHGALDQLPRRRHAPPGPGRRAAAAGRSAAGRRPGPRGGDVARRRGKPAPPAAGGRGVTAAAPVPEIAEIGVGLLGPAGVGRAHAHAYRLLPLVFWPPPARPRLVRVCGRDRARAETTAARFGFEAAGDRWEGLVADPAGPLLDKCAPNHLHP